MRHTLPLAAGGGKRGASTLAAHAPASRGSAPNRRKLKLAGEGQLAPLMRP
jgi:hypothetical protein